MSAGLGGAGSSGLDFEGNRCESSLRRRDLLEAGSGAVGGVETAHVRSGPAVGTRSRRTLVETEGARVFVAVPRRAAVLAYAAGGACNVSSASRVSEAARAANSRAACGAAIRFRGGCGQAAGQGEIQPVHWLVGELASMPRNWAAKSSAGVALAGAAWVDTIAACAGCPAYTAA